MKKLKIKKLLYRLKPPCSKCPYKRGLVHTLVNPCLQCKTGEYAAYEWFQKGLSGKR